MGERAEFNLDLTRVIKQDSVLEMAVSGPSSPCRLDSGLNTGGFFDFSDSLNLNETR